MRPAPAETPGWDLLRVSVVALIIISIGRVHHHVPGLSALRPGLIAVALGVAWVFHDPSLLRRGGALGTWPSKIVACLFVWSCLTAPFGLSFGGSAVYIVETYWKVIVFWILLTLAHQTVTDLSRTTWSFLAATAFLTYLAVFFFEKGEAEHVIRLTGDDMYMYDANDMALILNMAVPLALLSFRASLGWGKALAAGVIVAIVWAMAVTGSRGGFVGFVAVAGALFLLMKDVHVAKRLASVALLAVILAAAAPRGYWQQMATIVDTEDNYNYEATNGRLQIWKRGVSYMAAMPVTGVGIDNFGRAEGTISEMARNYRPGQQLLFAAPHNTFIQAGAELGVPGLALLAVLIVGGPIGLLRLRRRIPASWASGSAEQRYLYHATVFLPASWAGFAVTGMFVSFAYLTPLYILAALTSGVFAATKSLGGRAPSPIPHPSARVRVPGAGRRARTIIR